MSSFKYSVYYARYTMLRTHRESHCHGQKRVFSLVKARHDESTIVQVLRSPPVLHDSRADVHLISRSLRDAGLNPKVFLRTPSSEIVRHAARALRTYLQSLIKRGRLADM